MSGKVTSIWESDSDTESRDQPNSRPDDKEEFDERVIELLSRDKISRSDRNKIFAVVKRFGVKVYYSKPSDEKMFVRLVGKNTSKMDVCFSKVCGILELTTQSKDGSTKEKLEGKGRKEQRPKLTHFVSIPLNIPQVQERLAIFKDEVINAVPDIDERLFQVPEKLHLTLCMLSLTDDEKIQAAKTIFQSMARKFSDSFAKPITVDIEGLGYFPKARGKEDQARVIFGKISGEGREDIQLLANELLKELVDTGLSPPPFEDGPVKLHVTLMNNTFRERLATRDTVQKGKESWSKKPSPVPPSFDGRKVLELFTNFNFGQKIVIKELHISSLFEIGRDLFYKPLDKFLI